MTYDEVLQKLRETPREWRFKDQKIRLGDHCPLSYLADAPPCRVVASSNLLGLGCDAGWYIADAADKMPKYSPGIRADLLEACGLEEAVS